jgi:hypothetical protein
LKKDYSNLDQVFEKISDDSFCDRLADNSYQVVEESLTYEKLIWKLYQAL